MRRDLVPRLEAPYFGGPDWERMATVLRLSAAAYCPAWTVRVRRCTPAPRPSPLGVQSHVVNAQQLDCWQQIVEAAADGDRLLLLDADMFVVRPLDDLWAQPFDLAYTVRPVNPAEPRFPFNTGTIALRVSPAVRAAVQAWWHEVLRMTEDGAYHQVYRARYGGIQQAALGALLERDGLAGLQVRRLPCAEWNCEHMTWPTFDRAVTRIVHVTGELRRHVFGAGLRRDPGPPYTPILHAWREIEAGRPLPQPNADPQVPAISVTP